MPAAARVRDPGRPGAPAPARSAPARRAGARRAAPPSCIPARPARRAAGRPSASPRSPAPRQRRGRQVVITGGPDDRASGGARRRACCACSGPDSASRSSRAARFSPCEPRIRPSSRLWSRPSRRRSEHPPDGRWTCSATSLGRTSSMAPRGAVACVDDDPIDGARGGARGDRRAGGLRPRSPAGAEAVPVRPDGPVFVTLRYRRSARWPTTRRCRRSAD